MTIKKFAMAHNMKKLLTIFSIVTVLVPARIYSQYMIENFDYPDGVTLISTSIWGSLAPFGVNYMRITSPGLTFPGYIGSGIGNALNLDTTGPDEAFRHFDHPGLNSGNIYTSMIVRVFSASSNGSYFIGFAPDLDVFSFYDGIFIKEGAGGIAFGISKGSSNPVYTNTQYFKNVNYLLVLKHTFSDNSSDSLSLFVFSTTLPYAEPATPTIGPLTSGSDPSNLAAVKLFKAYGDPLLGLIVDGIAIDFSWNNSVLPVELSSFGASVLERNVTLKWVTSNEINNSGFYIERLMVNGSENTEWKNIGFINGHGNSASSNHYSFTDHNLSPAKYKFRLKQIDFNGSFEYHELQNEVTIDAPDKFSLMQNYPNPFNPYTKINFAIPVDTRVKLKIYDITGREVKTLVDDFKTAGYYSVQFSGNDLSSGVYYYEISAEGFNQTKRMILMK